MQDCSLSLKRLSVTVGVTAKLRSADFVRYWTARLAVSIFIP
jgi:hypothetical protein